MEISVVMTVFNGERWLRAAIESVRAQTFPDFEFVIVDDGSTDATPAILADYAARDARIRVVSQANQGVSRSMNAILPTIENEWIARFDADDLMMPDRLERQIAFINAHPDVAVASCFADYIDNGGEKVGSYDNPLTNRDIVARWLAQGRVIHFIQSGAIMRRDVVLEVGGYRPEFSVTEDTDLWNRIAERGYGVLVQPDVLMQVRVHERSLTRSSILLQAQQFRWLEEGARLRRAGLAEPSFEEFLVRERNGSWVQRLNTARLDYGRVYYKNAVVSRTRGARLAMVGHLLISTLLFPSHAAGNIWSKAVRPLIQPGVTPRAGLNG